MPTPAGRPLRCPHCGGTEFDEGEAQLNTSFMTLLGLDWLSRSALIYACKGCGRIEWFLPPPAPAPLRPATESECLACGAVIPPAESHCPKCGWTYA